MLTDEKIGGYYIAARRVLINIFGRREVMACVTSPAKESSTRRLFFSTIFPEQLEIFCAWQEKSPLNQTGSSRMQDIPFLLYVFRWDIEVSYYEQKTFWSLCSYMVRSQKGIEMLANLIIFLPRKQRKNGAFQKDGCKSYVRKTVYPAWQNSAACG